ncbi:T9SS type A sorting domain-containing protein [Crocinitomix catalasitica]|uniref:T9SS type A sorting domain-containing protein n=1 Tax=Crocinitomix catalasitica TaxID=184607 RepID=UPI000685FE22|nr:T9SS type A sorting domain-containing protein [Crocinitomix catalasitica]
MKRLYFKNVKRFALLLALAGIGTSGFSQLYPFSEHTFTNAGAEGKDGPTLVECQAAYAPEAWVLDPAFFNMTSQGIQEWTVPATGDYRIEAAGAQGGYLSYTFSPEEGGLGAVLQGEFELVEGQVLHIVVGQIGVQSIPGNGNAGPGGGGGTFIWDPTALDMPLMAAGGGGAGANPGGYEPRHATTDRNGNNTERMVNGGLDGNGGRPNNVASSWWSGAGAGWLTDGTGGNNAVAYDYNDGLQGGEGGRSPLNGGVGGIRWNSGTDSGGDGGFGGGGGGGSSYTKGGGGGGFSGGGGGHGGDRGAGGGSYNGGTDQINVVENEGNGWIRIELLCNPLELVATSTGVCAGESVTFTATSVTGGDVSWDMGVENGESFVPPLGETVYRCVSTSPDDCVLDVVVTSTEVPVLIPNSSSPAACEGTYLTLWGEGGDTYTWDRGVIDSEPFEAEPGVVTYTLNGSLLGCEGEPVTITLTGAQRPDASSTATPSEICLGDSYVLTGDGGAETYNWGRGINDGDELTPASPGSYTHIVIGNSDVGCGDTSMVTVIVHGLPEVHGGSDVAVCEGEEVTLTGSGTRTISWDMGITNGVPFAAEAGEIVYTVTGTDINGCEDTDEVLVTGVEIPRIASSDITPEYFGYDGVIDITVEGGSGEYTYAWSHGPTTEDASSLTDGTYTVIINDITLEKGLCPMEATFTIGTELGLDDVEFVELNVYPNPTTDRLVIVTAGTFNYDVLSITGEVILKGKGTDQAELSMEELANGAYIIRVNANDKIGFAQVVKQ